jgi:hypothetical protein
VMGLIPMHRGDAAYYEWEITHCLEAYFDGRGEEPGRWIGYRAIWRSVGSAAWR